MTQSAICRGASVNGRIAQLGAALTVACMLCSCSPSDESLARSIQGSTRASDVFVSACFKTGVDLARIRHIAVLAGWHAVNHLPVPTGGASGSAWQLDIGGQRAALFVASGPDDRPNSPTVGRPMNVCGLEYFGNNEPGFVQEVTDQLGLKRVDPSNYLIKRPDNGVMLSESGREDGSLEVAMMHQSIFLIGNMTMAIATATE